MANWNMGHNHFPGDVGVQCGTTGTAAVEKNSYADVAVTFPVAFYTTPAVVACASSGNAMNCEVQAINATATGFTCRMFNHGTWAANLTASWIAVGTPK